MTLSTRAELRAPIIAALHRLLGSAPDGGARWAPAIQCSSNVVLSLPKSETSVQLCPADAPGGHPPPADEPPSRLPPSDPRLVAARAAVVAYARNFLPILFNIFVAAPPEARSSVAGAVSAFSAATDPATLGTFFRTVMKKYIKVREEASERRETN